MRDAAAPEMTVPHGATDPGDDLADFGFPTGAEGNDEPRRPAIGDPIAPSPVPADDPRLVARRERMTGRRRRSATTPLLRVVGVLAFLLIGLLVLFPAQAAALLGFGTSSSETMQRTSRVDDSGISTAIRRPAQPTIAVTPTVRPTPALARANDPTREELSDEARARLAALEEAIQRLADRPAGATGPTADEIQALLDRQSAALREEADARENLLRAQLDALQAGAYVDDGAAEAERLRLEAEERARLRERAERRREEHEAELARRAAEREAELLERRLSDANVFDESEYGATSGTADEAGVRELSEDELFLRDAGNATVKTVRARTLRDPSSTVVQGTVIPAVLETAIDTQLPGTLRAQVTRPVWSFDGSRVVMPSGTRLIGTYNSRVEIAQNRVLIAWTRAITPEGRSVELAASGTDTLGRAGQRGNVDNRFLQRFGSAAVISTLSALPGLLDEGEDAAREKTVAIGAGRDVVGDFASGAEDALGAYLELPPVIRVPQGTVMNVLVNRDLDFG